MVDIYLNGRRIQIMGKVQENYDDDDESFCIYGRKIAHESLD